MALIGYARVSTDKQATDLQLDLLKQHGVTTIYEDCASGVGNRRQLSQALKSLKPNDVLVFYKLDRLARSLSDLLSIIQKVQNKGASIRSLTEPVDTSHAGGRLLIQILGAFAEFERSIIAERTLAGMRAARDSGKSVCFPRKLTDDDMADIRTLYATGLYTQETLAIIFEVAQYTISRRLRSPYKL